VRASVLVLTALLAAGCFALPGCQPAVEIKPPPPPKVVVDYPIQQDVEDSAYFTGRIEAVESVDVRARIQGWLDYVNIPKKDEETGEVTWEVDEGDVLFVIEKEPYQAELNAALARLQQTRAAQMLAQANLARAEKLIQTNAISREDYDTRVAEKAAADAKEAGDRAAIEQAQIDLNYATIRSPIAGRASRNLVDAGNLVGTGEDTLLCTVVSNDPMNVYFDVTEKDVLELLKNLRERAPDKEVPELKVYVGLDNETGYPHVGVVDYLDNVVKASTGTAQVRAELPNPKNARFFKPGMNARVRVPLEVQKDAVLVREDAIGTDLGGKYVLAIVDKDGKQNIVERRYVELGTLTEGMRVVRNGLDAQEKYIVEGIQRARPGMPVTVEMAKPSEEAPATAPSPASGEPASGGPAPVAKPAPTTPAPVTDPAGQPTSPPGAPAS